MSKWMLDWFWKGVSLLEITERAKQLDPNITESKIREHVERERQKIIDKSLKAVIENATKGDPAAIDWLEKKGFMTIPDQLPMPPDTD